MRGARCCTASSAAGATAVVLAVAIAWAGCGRNPNLTPSALGDVRRGKALATRYACQTCHSIPGVAGANATVGPPLDRFARRVYAGGLLNTPWNLIRFLRNPPAVNPRTPMPNVGLTEADARDVAAFLYSLD